MLTASAERRCWAVGVLQRENARLRRQLQLAWGQVGDMKQFLTDYGMVWVGSGSNTADVDADVDDERARVGVDAASQPPPPFVEHPPGRAREAKATSSAATAETTETATMATDGGVAAEDVFVADMALLVEKVDELNALAGACGGRVEEGFVCCTAAAIRCRSGELYLLTDGLCSHLHGVGFAGPVGRKSVWLWLCVTGEALCVYIKASRQSDTRQSIARDRSRVVLTPPHWTGVVGCRRRQGGDCTGAVGRDAAEDAGRAATGDVPRRVSAARRAA